MCELHLLKFRCDRIDGTRSSYPDFSWVLPVAYTDNWCARSRLTDSIGGSLCTTGSCNYAGRHPTLLGTSAESVCIRSSGRNCFAMDRRALHDFWRAAHSRCIRISRRHSRHGCRSCEHCEEIAETPSGHPLIEFQLPVAHLLLEGNSLAPCFQYLDFCAVKSAARHRCASQSHCCPEIVFGS